MGPISSADRYGTMIKAHTVPWTEHSVLTRSGNEATGRSIVAEGSLRDMMDRIASTHVLSREALSLHFPDRHVPPFGYEARSFAALLTEGMRPARRA